MAPLGQAAPEPAATHMFVIARPARTNHNSRASIMGRVVLALSPPAFPRGVTGQPWRGAMLQDGAIVIHALARLLHPRAGEFDDLFPFFGFGRDHLTEFRR